MPPLQLAARSLVRDLLAQDTEQYLALRHHPLSRVSVVMPQNKHTQRYGTFRAGGINPPSNEYQESLPSTSADSCHHALSLRLLGTLPDHTSRQCLYLDKANDVEFCE